MSHRRFTRSSALGVALAFLFSPLLSAAALEDGKFDVVYGIGVSATYFDSAGTPGYVLTRRKDVLPAFTVAALWDFGKPRVEVGPMLVSNVAIGGGGASVEFDSIGVGIMIAFRGDLDDWLNGLGIGVAYSLDREVELQHRVDRSMTAKAAGHGVSVVLTYSFGKGG